VTSKARHTLATKLTVAKTGDKSETKSTSPIFAGLATVDKTATNR